MNLTGRLGSETVTVLRRPPVTVFPTMGDKADPSTFDIEGCSVFPNTVTEKVSSLTGVEKVDSQFTVLSGVTVLAPYGSDIRPTDQMTIHDPAYSDEEGNALVYQVNGQPSPWRSPITGRQAVLEIQLKAAQG